MSSSVEPDLRQTSSLDLWGRAAHDLRQSVQSLMFTAQIMADMEDGTKRRQIARTMEDALVGLQVMLDDLGTAARLQSGTDGLRPAPCLMSDVVARAARGIAGIAKDRNVVVTYAVEPATVTNDAQWLEKVLVALVLNAINFRSRKAITVDCRPCDDGCRLEIAFEGPPLSAAQLRLVFVELPPLDGQLPMARPILGPAFVEQLASVLGCQFQYTASSTQAQRFALLLPARPPALSTGS